MIICLRLTNARDSLKFNTLRMPVTCFWIYWLKWDTIVLYIDQRSEINATRLWVVIKYPLIWDLMLHPNTKSLFLTLGLPSNQRHCNFEEHFSPSLLCEHPQTILLDKVWPKTIMIIALGHNISFSKCVFMVLYVSIEQHFQENKAHTSVYKIRSMSFIVTFCFL